MRAALFSSAIRWTNHDTGGAVQEDHDAMPKLFGSVCASMKAGWGSAKAGSV